MLRQLPSSRTFIQVKIRINLIREIKTVYAKSKKGKAKRNHNGRQRGQKDNLRTYTGEDQAERR